MSDWRFTREQKKLIVEIHHDRVFMKKRLDDRERTLIYGTITYPNTFIAFVEYFYYNDYERKIYNSVRLKWIERLKEKKNVKI